MSRSEFEARTRLGVPPNSRTLGKRLAASTELLPHDVELPEGKWIRVMYSGDKELLDLEEVSCALRESVLALRQVRELWQAGFGRICSLEQVEQAIDNSSLVKFFWTERVEGCRSKPLTPRTKDATSWWGCPGEV